MGKRSKVAFLAFVIAQVASGQQAKQITITEPGVYQLPELFKAADSVVVATIVSGDTENYDRAIYKAEVVKSFKGARAGETIYFGPYIGERLGWEYILFLRNAPEAATPKTKPNAGYGVIRYAQVFDEGYTSMMTSYECNFEGKKVKQECDYGVQVCTDYIKLPKSVLTAPPGSVETPFGCRFVRKNIFVALLESLSSRGANQ